MHAVSWFDKLTTSGPGPRALCWQVLISPPSDERCLARATRATGRRKTISDHPSRSSTRMLALLDHHFAVDDRGLDTVRSLDVAPLSAWHVVCPHQLAAAHRV